MTDRVRMKALSTFNNPLITSHAENAKDEHTVTDGDEFSTSEDHAKELEALHYAERTKGEAAPLSESAARLIGAQTSTDTTAIVSGRRPAERTLKATTPAGDGKV